ncbi:HlyD family type I secretion periplasmic adaptor subunit [Microvirga mediterraneensis]|uniref:Membrane fusion protein (MFP) family protein n=1 Tax=Microvirga mediterraneensis TaxID=2754695 RepID=A0A838BGC0_9HYPH|nr:HlyD family type I secretion periplasmic adaptor subunit [Microvirga mediterraneensis]MBA1154514.1 HlyD family type I secretion periplasmic adaptor subunit [Microvirga mediterraneensis]
MRKRSEIVERKPFVPATYATVHVEATRDRLPPRDLGEPSYRGPVIAGLATIFLGLGGLTTWAFSAHLDSAAIATATVVVDSKRKTISHLEGGILKTLLAHEGEVVKAGQPLLRLDDTRAKAELEQLRSRRLGLEARLVRLRAEQAGLDDLTFPDALLQAGGPTAEDILNAERKYFTARREMFNRRVDIQRKTIAQQVAELQAVQSQTEANTRQAELLDRELKAIAGLVEKGYAPRPRLTEMQTRESQLKGNAGELVSRKAKAEQAKAAAELEILSLGNDFQQQVASDIQTAQLELADTVGRIDAATDILRRVEIVSPERGIVTNIRSHTLGSVIGAGQPILDIVPENEPLIVEAKIGLRDVDAVRVGAPVQIRLTAYNSRSTPPLAGKLTYLSADQQMDDRNNYAYFVARAEIAPESLNANSKVALYPGMPAEVLIVNKPRRAIDYLLAPITESFDRAFREE